jgi:DNA-binding MarR family transcriptional regulator
MTQEEVRWLSRDEQRIWRSYLAAVQWVESRTEQQMQADTGIPMAYYEIMVRLSEAPDRSLRMSELSEVSYQSRSRLSHSISRLEEAGWVERRACATDRRGAFAVLTGAGFAALEAAAPGHVTQVRSHLFDRLTPEQAVLLGQICDAIAAPSRGPSEAVDA